MADIRSLVRERLAQLQLNGPIESGLAEELSQHLEDRYRELCNGGSSDQEAFQQIAAELEDLHPLQDDMEKKRAMLKHQEAPVASASSGSLLEDLWRDLRYATRTIRKAKAFSFFVILTLALGIGANTVVFTIVNTFLLNPLPVHSSSELAGIARLETKNTSRAAAPLPISYADLKDYRSRNKAFTSLAGYTSTQVVTLQTAGMSERMFSELVTGNFFPTLGIQPVRGRFLSEEDDRVIGGNPAAVMNYATWQSRFGGADDIIGKKLTLNNVAFTVIGIAPPNFIGISAIFGPDVWVPASAAPFLIPAQMQNLLTDRTKAEFYGVGRLRPGVSHAQAQADLALIASSLAREYPAANEGRTATARPISDVLLGNDNSGNGRAPILFGTAVLLAVVGIVLLIACSNVANLMLARAAARQQEIAIRLAIGGSRGRLVRQLLTESVVLGVLGGVLGLVMGIGGAKLLWSLRPADVATNLVTPKLDSSVFLFTFAISILTGLIFGIIPAIRGSRFAVAEALKQEARTAGRSRQGISLANALLVGQVAFSFLSLVIAALFLRSIGRAYEIDPGFQTKNLAIFLTNPEQAGYGRVQTIAFYKQVRERAITIPGVQSASWASNLPLWSGVVNGLEIEGREQRTKADKVNSVITSIDVGFFDTAGIALTQGRAFSPADQETSLPVAIVNARLARDYWPQGNAIGKRILLPDEKQMRQIVGIARTANYTTLGEPQQACVYVPSAQKFSPAMTLYVRSKQDPQTIMLATQRIVKDAAPQILVNDVRSGRKILEQALFSARAGVGMLSVFGIVALSLASIGLYGVMTYSVAQRRREIGVRIALGAANQSVLRMILKQGMLLVMGGVLLGFAASLLVGKLLSKMLFGVGPNDPISVTGAAAVLVLVGFIACYLPARRAGRIDPLIALRQE